MTGSGILLLDYMNIQIFGWRSFGYKNLDGKVSDTFQNIIYLRATRICDKGFNATQLSHWYKNA